MGLTVPPGRTHMFYTGTPEFAFGAGLSYTEWGMAWNSSQSHAQGDELVFSLEPRKAATTSCVPSRACARTARASLARTPRRPLQRRLPQLP